MPAYRERLLGAAYKAAAPLLSYGFRLIDSTLKGIHTALRSR